MVWELQQVAGPFGFTEGPAWDGRAVLFTDIPANRVMRYDPVTGECAEHRTGTGAANGLMFDRDGRLHACEGGDARRMVRYEHDGDVTVLADRYQGRRLNSPNDLAFDPDGRLWFTDPRYGDRSDLELDHESVYRLDPQPDGGWSLRRMTYDTTRPNGLLVSADGATLYVAQSDYGEDRPRQLRAYPIEGDTLGDHRVLHDFGPHRGIDGMCLDVDGDIIACAGWRRSGPGPLLYVFAPSGRVLETHPVPVDTPTNCTFGGEDLRTLYVTAGARLFRARTERRGYLIYPPSS